MILTPRERQKLRDILAGQLMDDTSILLDFVEAVVLAILEKVK